MGIVLVVVDRLTVPVVVRIFDVLVDGDFGGRQEGKLDGLILRRFRAPRWGFDLGFTMEHGKAGTVAQQGEPHVARRQ